MPYSREESAGVFRDFDRIQIGDAAELVHRLTEEDILAFARLTGDYNPLHVDAEFAARTPFRRPVVHGMLSASFLSTLIGMLLPGKGALWVSQSLRFQAPAFAGDTLRIQGRVKHWSPATRMVVLSVSITNQNDQELIGGEASVRMPEGMEEKPAAASSDEAATVITGASRGIGAAVARRLAADGHAVVVNYLRSAEEAQRLVAEIVAAGGRAIAVQADVTRADDVARLVSAAREQIGRVEALVHCAALPSALSPFEGLDWPSVRRHLEVQVGGAMNCVKAVLPAMIEARSGAIVFIGSVAADGPPPAMQTDYVVAKAALTALARCLAVEHGPKGVRVNVLAPGMTATDMTAHLPEKAKMLAKMQSPLRRIAEPEDIARAAGFLLGRGASHITGETLRVCGGSVMV
ncbi:MAG TPA: SDR family oxidoreductase [Candidatus Nanopelagicales bacterium]|nr:SDR family oxidoreductase [Candidatus Nanopelagicales bacterium]